MNTCSKSRPAVPSSGFLEVPWKVFGESLCDCLDPNDEGMKRGLVFRDVLSKEDAARVPEGKPTRDDVFDLARDRTASIESVCATAMAWGGMHVGGWRRLWNSGKRKWLTVAQCIRDEKPTRAKAYSRFSALRQENELPEMGPAFFTKLIYFLTGCEGAVCKPAYIMDRWAASSVNLLTGSNRVLLNASKTWERSNGKLDVSYRFTVSDANTRDRYEAFCTAVDRLAVHFCLRVDQVDCALFSIVNRRPGTWRRYVQAHGEALL